MFEVSIKFKGIRIDVNHVNVQSNLLAERVADHAVNHTKIALVSFGAIATGRTLRGIQKRFVSNRNSAAFGTASTGLYRRQVTAPKGFKYIVSGRRAGAKMPIRFVGTGPRGGKQFEPLPALQEWFNALNIPKGAWWPILRAISRRGIKPRNVPARAVKGMMPAVRREARLTGAAIARGILVKK